MHRNKAIHPYINQEEWKGIDFPARTKDIKTGKKSIALNYLFLPYNKKEKKQA